MGLEQRKGSTYYTRSVRVNGKVKREYLGSGAWALFAFEIEQAERLEERLRKMQERQQWQQEQDAVAALGHTVEAVCEEAGAAFRMVMEAAGYHRHERGEWRKRRQDKLDETETAT